MEQENIDQYLNQQGAIVTDLAMRISAMERLLIKKNLVSEQEIVEMLKSISDELMIMIKANMEKAASSK
jgi:hypothetical protein